MRARIAAAVGLVVFLTAFGAGGEPLRILSPFHVTTQGGVELDLAPGRYLPEAEWAVLDVEVKRLQEAETRLAAENTSLRASADAGPGWVTWAAVGIAFAAGIGAASLSF